MAMTAHIAYEAFDPSHAATVSPTMIQDIIRGQIGYNGLLMTDDLGMQALGGTLSERAEAALSAGCDVLLHCSGFLSDPDEIFAEMREVAVAATALEGDSLDRAAHADSMATLEKPFEPVEAWAKFYDFFPTLEAAA